MTGIEVEYGTVRLLGSEGLLRVELGGSGMRLSKLLILAGWFSLVLAAAGWISRLWQGVARPEALVEAVRTGNAVGAESLLVDGADPNTRVTPYPRLVGKVWFTRPTLLVIAVAGNDLAMAKILLRHGASPLVRRSSLHSSSTLAQVALTLPAPWPRLLNGPASGALPPAASAPMVNTRALSQRVMLPMYLPTVILVMLGGLRLRWAIHGRHGEPDRCGKDFLQGAGLLFLAFLSLFLYPIIN